jgi:hypothetical protein
VYNRVRAEKKLAGNALSLPARTKTFLRQSRKTEGVSRPKKLNTGLLRLFVQDMHPEKTARSFAAFGLYDRALEWYFRTYRRSWYTPAGGVLIGICPYPLVIF